jgi:hypothetical protein
MIFFTWRNKKRKKKMTRVVAAMIRLPVLAGIVEMSAFGRIDKAK